MDTKNFNLLDKLIAKMRYARVKKFIKDGDDVLDFGCGYEGAFLRSVDKLISQGTGIDYETKRKQMGNIRLIKHKFKNRLPFDDEAFSIVVMMAVLEHIEPGTVEGLFLEFNRVLKPGGKIVLTTPTPKSKKFLEFLSYKLKLISKGEIMDHKKYYSRKDLDYLTKTAGMVLEEYKLFQLGGNSLAVFKKS